MGRIIRNAEFTNRSADSRYPLLPTATAKDASSVFELPNDFLVGLYLAVPSDLQINPTTYHVTSVTNVNNRTVVSVGGALGGTIVTVGRFDVLWQSTRTQILAKGYGVATFVGAGQYSDIRGRLMIGSIDSISNQPQGTFSFNPIGGGLSIDCIRPVFRHLSSLQVLAASGQTYKLSGAVRLRGGDNVRLTVEVQDDQPVVVIDAVDATAFSESLDCDVATAAASIKTINGLPGNNNREVTLVGSRCLTVDPLTFGIQLTNSCSEPCASCAEAEALKSMIEPFAIQIPMVTSVANRLDNAVTKMQQSIGSSQIGCPTPVE
jgi:hypothetical protein